MPSTRPSRKLFLPTDSTDRSIEQLIVEDMSKIEHKAPSDIFNDAIFFRYQPKGEFATEHFRSVYAGYVSLLEDISEVMYRNSDGANAVLHCDYQKRRKTPFFRYGDIRRIGVSRYVYTAACGIL